MHTFNKIGQRLQNMGSQALNKFSGQNAATATDIELKPAKPGDSYEKTCYNKLLAADTLRNELCAATRDLFPYSYDLEAAQVIAITSCISEIKDAIKSNREDFIKVASNLCDSLGIKNNKAAENLVTLFIEQTIELAKVVIGDDEIKMFNHDAEEMPNYIALLTDANKCQEYLSKFSKQSLNNLDFEILELDANDEQSDKVYQTIIELTTNPANLQSREALNFGDANSIAKKFLKETIGIEPVSLTKPEQYGNALIYEYLHNGVIVKIGRCSNKSETASLIELTKGRSNSLDILISGATKQEQKFTLNKFISHAMLLIKLPGEEKFTQVDPKSALGRFFSAPDVIPHGEGRSQILEQGVAAGFQTAISVDCVRHCATIATLIAIEYLISAEKPKSVEDACKLVWAKIGGSEYNSIAFANGCQNFAASDYEPNYIMIDELNKQLSSGVEPGLIEINDD